MYLQRLNEHVRDSRIVFDEEPHIYYVDNKAIKTSVTTLVHEMFPKFDADEIIKKMKKNEYSFKKSKYFGMTDSEIKKMWKDLGTESCRLGTKMHKNIELFYNGEEMNEEPEIEKEMELFEEFQKDHKNMNAYRTEWEIFDEEHNLAGSIDMVFQNEDNTYSIWDWKRSKEIKMNNRYEKGLSYMENYDNCNYIHYSLQLNIYKNILERLYSIKIRDMYLVCIHEMYTKYKKYKVIDLQEEVEEILRNRKENLKTTEIDEKIKMENKVAKCVKMRDDAVIPYKSNETDAGYDVTIIDVHKKMGKVTLYNTGIKVKPEYGYYFDMVPRSSVIKSGYMLANSVGVIDQDYTGEILVALIKIDEEMKDIELPMRIAQLIPRKWYPMTFRHVDTLEETARGEGGFGSTGN